MDYDVCIVGAGPAGALAAYKIASSGKSVVLLDAGPRFDFLGKERYASFLRGGTPWDWEIPERDYYEEEASPGIWLNDNRVKGVGGTTLKWNARADRLQPADFKMYSRFGLFADWPVTYEDLKPWFFEAEQEIGVAGKESPGSPPRDSEFPMPNHPSSYAEREYVKPAFEEVGIPLGYESLAINSQAYDGRPRCDMHLTCMAMCPTHAKYTAMAHVMKAESTGNTVVKPDCHVRRVKLDSKRRVRSLQYKDQEGNTVEQQARAFILAAGGIEIPRLLLLSANENYQNGLANSSGQVGKNYMTHPWISVWGNLPVEIATEPGGFGTMCGWGLYNHKNLPETGNVMFKTKVKGVPEPATIALESELWGEELLKKIRRDYRTIVFIDVIGEMAPRSSNQVRLSDSSLDCFGDRVPRLELKLSDFDKKALYDGVSIAKNIMKAMKAENIDD